MRTTSCILFLILAFCHAAEAEWRSNLVDAKKVAADTNKPLLLYFSADWCAPCKIVKRNLDDTKLTQWISDNFVHVNLLDAASVAADKSELAKKIWDDYKVTAIPTVIIVTPQGAERCRLTEWGYSPERWKEILAPFARKQ